MKNNIIIDPLADKIFKDIYNQGGYVYLVGGCVRDYLLNKKSHDIDVEVYHISYDKLKNILSKYGYVNEFGKSFSIINLSTLPHYDFALPRKENKTGVKHQDFNIIIDKNLPIQEAIKRRDFTMNALLYDYQKQEIIDLVSGIEDINNKIIKMVSKKTFKEDPLRILRVASFMSRFDMKVDNDTKECCKEMVNNKELENLSIERIYEEYNKILMSNHPSLGLEFLKEIDALPFYLKDLIGCYQRKDYHPEGDVWNHTMLVVDLGALCKQHTNKPLSFMWSCLLHDIGKPLVTTIDGKAPGHNESGVKVFEKVKLIKSKDMRVYISTMIMYHMHLMNMARNNSRDITYLRLLKNIDKKITLSDLMYISECDKLGRGKVTSEQYNQFITYMNDKISRLGDKALSPIVDGNDLIENGFENHKQYKYLLNKAYDLQLQGYKKDKIIKILKKELRK